ncbi:MAG: hypothetical protein RJA22_2824 [Verrucomicrobiota bacterium]
MNPLPKRFPERRAPRFLLYSHDAFGLGHTRRHVAIASALAQAAPSASILLASGVDDVYRLGLPPGAEALKLPGLRKVGNGDYQSRRLRIPTSDIRALRAALLEAAVREFRPDVVLVDKHPLGAGGEFAHALAEVRRYGGRAALGLRDILDEPATVLAEWTAGNLRHSIETLYDLILIYGDQSVFDPVTEYEFSPATRRRTRFCGYVLNQGGPDLTDPSPPLIDRHADPRPLVMATTGGGEDGFFLLETFLRAATGAPWRGVVVAGPMTPPHELQTLRHMATERHVELHTFVSNIPALLEGADALVSMGGYNTLIEGVATGLPVVCVPRTFPRREQQLRARSFARLGLLQTLSPEQLSTESLREAVDAALHVPRRAVLDRVQATLSFGGARHAANHLLALSAEAQAATVS